MLAPICLFTYNRLAETQQTVAALKENFLAPECDLFIFSDGPRTETATPKVEAVRKFLGSVTGFKSVTIIQSDKNKGLANSIISGVSEIIEKFGKVIVLEDDLITRQNFLDFMNQALTFYKDETRIHSVNGFSLFIKSISPESDVYFQVRPFSWGWGTWADRWSPDIFDKQLLRQEINANRSILTQFRKTCGDDMPKMFLNSLHDKNDSWYVRWAFHHFKEKRYSVYPGRSLVENIGFGETGTHCKGINSFNYQLSGKNNRTFGLPPFSIPKRTFTREYLNYFSVSHKLFIRTKLLFSQSGRKQIIAEIKNKFSQ